MATGCVGVLFPVRNERSLGKRPAGGALPGARPAAGRISPKNQAVGQASRRSPSSIPPLPKGQAFPATRPPAKKPLTFQVRDRRDACPNATGPTRLNARGKCGDPPEPPPTPDLAELLLSPLPTGFPCGARRPERGHSRPLSGPHVPQADKNVRAPAKGEIAVRRRWLCQPDAKYFQKVCNSRPLLDVNRCDASVFGGVCRGPCKFCR